MPSIEESIRRAIQLHNLEECGLDDFGTREYPNDRAVAVWQLGRGGVRLIVGDDSVLAYSSRYTSDQAIARWREGERTSTASFVGGESVFDNDREDGLEDAATVAESLFPRWGDGVSLFEAVRFREIDAAFVAEPIRGGRAVIVGPSGDLLYCPSSHPVRQHINAWRRGSRSSHDDVPRWNNASSCAYASYLRLTGIDVRAVSQEMPISAAEMEHRTGLTFNMSSQAELQSTLLALGSDAAAIVGIDRGSAEPGHWFNATIDGNQLLMVDGQHQQILPWAQVDFGVVTKLEAAVGSAR